MPDVITVRNHLIPAAERVTNIASDLNDTGWFSEIDGSDGAIFFAFGVVCYLQIAEARSLFNNMVIASPRGKLVCDTFGKMALKLMIKTFIKQAGIKNINGYFYVGSIEKDIKPWMKNAEISYRDYMFGYNDLRVSVCRPCSD